MSTFQDLDFKDDIALLHLRAYAKKNRMTDEEKVRLNNIDERNTKIKRE